MLQTRRPDPMRAAATVLLFGCLCLPFCATHNLSVHDDAAAPLAAEAAAHTDGSRRRLLASRRRLLASKRGGKRGGRSKRGGRGRRGRGRVAAPQYGSAAASTAPAIALGACAHKDEARLEGTGCTVEAAAQCNVRYVMFRVVANDKFLAPREQGVVFAAVRARFKREQSAPWERFAWRVVPQQGEWVRLQHVLTGKWLRLVPPSDPEAWVVRVERDAEKFGKQTWWRIEGDPAARTGGSGGGAAAGGETTVRLQAHATSGYLNYRVSDMARCRACSSTGAAGRVMCLWDGCGKGLTRPLPSHSTTTHGLRHTCTTTHSTVRHAASERPG